MLRVESLDRKTSGDNNDSNNCNVSKVYENFNEQFEGDDDDDNDNDNDAHNENDLLLVDRLSRERFRRNKRSRLANLLICTYCDEASRPWADSESSTQSPASNNANNEDDDDNWTTRVAQQPNDDQNEYYG